MEVRPYPTIKGTSHGYKAHETPSLSLYTSPCEILYEQHATGRRGRVLSTPASCSGGTGFKSRPADRLYVLMLFVVLLSLLSKCEVGGLN
jgi:hypothetical protein